MPFRLLHVGTKDAFWIDERTGSPLDFETGAEAQSFSKVIMATNSGIKLRVKRVLDTKWKVREQRKFETGFYVFVPWYRSDWWNGARAMDIHHLHFPHVSRKEPGMMAYTESVEKGMDNKQTTIKVGRYLEKYFGELLKEYAVDVRVIVAHFEKTYRPRPVHIAKTEEEIERVYDHGPKSCMSGRAYRAEHGWGFPSPGKWPMDIHACKTYAAGDLEVAYLTGNDKPASNNVTARAVIWPEKKTFSRVYGDVPALSSQLYALGYSESPPIGAKIKRIQCEGRFIVPYIDAGHRSGAGALGVIDKKTHLEIQPNGPGVWPANGTGGISGYKLDAQGRRMESVPDACQHCEENIDDCGELSRVERSGSSGDRQYWCHSCIDDCAYYCDASERYYASDAVPPVMMANGQRWSTVQFRANGFRCSATNLNYPRQQRVNMYNGQMWHHDYFRANGFRCGYTGDNYPNTMKVVMLDGSMWSRPAFEQYGFVCATCGQNDMRGHSSRRDSICHQCQRNATVAGSSAAAQTAEERNR